MDNQIAQFVDNYDNDDRSITADMDQIGDIEIINDDVYEPTLSEAFNEEIDAWARHAFASNGFGGF